MLVVDVIPRVATFRASSAARSDFHVVERQQCVIHIGELLWQGLEACEQVQQAALSDLRHDRRSIVPLHLPVRSRASNRLAAFMLPGLISTSGRDANAGPLRLSTLSTQLPHRDCSASTRAVVIRGACESPATYSSDTRWPWPHPPPYLAGAFWFSGELDPGGNHVRFRLTRDEIEQMPANTVEKRNATSISFLRISIVVTAPGTVPADRPRSRTESDENRCRGCRFD